MRTELYPPGFLSERLLTGPEPSPANYGPTQINFLSNWGYAGMFFLKSGAEPKQMFGKHLPIGKHLPMGSTHLPSWNRILFLIQESVALELGTVLPQPLYQQTNTHIYT